MMVRFCVRLVSLCIACFVGASAVLAADVPGGTVLPTETVPIPTAGTVRPLSTELQTRVWQHLPLPFYYTATVETTYRQETNPFQYSLKRTLLNKVLPAGTDYQKLSLNDKIQINNELAGTAANDLVYRINPNVTAGWAMSPNCQVFGNVFLIRDVLARHPSLNTSTEAASLGVQQSIPLGKKGAMVPQFMARELWQNHEIPVLDYLPNITYQYSVTGNLIAYVNALLQLRFKHFASGAMREMDPFYTCGLNYQRGRWTFSASSTFFENFRKQFGSDAIVPQNNYSVVCDFEIDRQLSERTPGLVALVRAEPVYNFHSHATEGLAGMDFRMYYGLRWSAAKPALNATMQQLRQRYQQQVRDSISKAESN